MSWLVSNIGSSGKTGGVTARGEDGQQIDVDAVLEGEGGQQIDVDAVHDQGGGGGRDSQHDGGAGWEHKKRQGYRKKDRNVSDRFLDLQRADKEKTEKPGNNTLTCYNCKQTGHLKRSCINPKVIDCFRCGEIGHKISDCKTSIGGGKGASDQVGGQAETYAGVVGDKHKIGRGDSDTKRTEDLAHI